MTECTCPVCDGTGRMPTPDNLRGYGERFGWYGYSHDDDKVTCNNCGGQTMSGHPTGKSRLREDGTPCIHEVVSTNLGRCFNRYTCKHCGYSYDIDCGD